MPATLTTVSRAPNSSTRPVNSVAHGVLVGDGDVRRARLTAGVDDPLRGGGLGAALTGRAVDGDAGVDGDDVHTGAPELLGDGGADADRASGDDGDAHDPSSIVGSGLEREAFEVAVRAPLGEQVLVAEEVAVATAVRAAARVQHGGVTLEVESRRCARGHERAVVAPGAEDDVGPCLLGLLGGLEHLHALRVRARRWSRPRGRRPPPSGG